MAGAVVVFAGGCMSGFYRGHDEKILPEPVREVKTPETAPAGPSGGMKLPSREPVYAGADDDWTPNLAPIRRAVWAPASPIGDRLSPMGEVKRITIHHEGSDRYTACSTVTQVANCLREIRKYHVQHMSAGDIGYHFVIDREGRIWEGRPEKYRGAHAGGDSNANNLGIMLLGNFDVQYPTARQLRSLEMFLRLQMARHRVGVRNVFTHQELKPTACPGKHLQAHMNRFRASL